VAIKEIKIKDIRSKDKQSTDKEVQEEASKAVEAEAKALDDLTGLNHNHIIQRIAAITRGTERYFMFQWADGGSLADFWQNLPRPPLDPDFVKNVVQQLHGLAGALNELHNYKGKESYRHGDLKPDNILRFKDGTRVGTFKIADMGLAKHHAKDTYLRPPTSTRFGTVRYEPPEVVTHKLDENGRSRLYDIWSMGCIALEFIVWLLYGYEELMKFNDAIRGSMQEEGSPYFTVEEDEDNVLVGKVHPKVRACIDHLSNDPECINNTAMSDLLELVSTKLLVVELPTYRPSARNLSEDSPSQARLAVTPAPARARPPSIGPFRADARAFYRSLDGMIGKGKTNEHYWFTGIPRDSLKGPLSVPLIATRGNFLSPESARRPPQQAPLADRRREISPGRLSAQLGPSSVPNVSELRYCLAYISLR
jgi:serine/threonine protein kinase